MSILSCQPSTRRRGAATKIKDGDTRRRSFDPNDDFVDGEE